MKVKFLIPEIDKKKFAEEFSEKMRFKELELQDLAKVGNEEVSTASIWQYREGIKFPTPNRFLTLCRYFLTSPDVFLSPIPKWIECEMDDISKFRIYGKFNDVYYVAPKEMSELKVFGSYHLNIYNTFSEEPDPNRFWNFHFYGTKYDVSEMYKDGKVMYRFPCVNDDKTGDLIEHLISEYQISYDTLQILLGFNQKESLRRRIKKTQAWTMKDLYKLSWIFNKTIEDLLVIDYYEETHESVFDPVLFLEHYLEEGEKELWPDIEETDEDTADILFNVEEIEVPIIDDVEIEYL